MDCNLLILDYEMLLKYLRLFLSPQFIAGAGFFFFVLFFKRELRELIGRIRNIKTPFGSGDFDSQKDKAKEIAPSEKKLPDIEVEQLPEGLHLKPEEIGTIRDLIQSERMQARLWEYRFLNFFLVRHTQEVLDWLASSERRISIELYHNTFSFLISDIGERSCILRVLTNHFLIEIQKDLIEVTPKGKEYIAWRGPLPSVQSH